MTFPDTIVDCASVCGGVSVCVCVGVSVCMASCQVMRAALLSGHTSVAVATNALRLHCPIEVRFVASCTRPDKPGSVFFWAKSAQSRRRAKTFSFCHIYIYLVRSINNRHMNDDVLYKVCCCCCCCCCTFPFQLAFEWKNMQISMGKGEWQREG